MVFQAELDKKYYDELRYLFDLSVRVATAADMYLAEQTGEKEILK